MGSMLREGSSIDDGVGGSRRRRLLDLSHGIALGSWSIGVRWCIIGAGVMRQVALRALCMYVFCAFSMALISSNHYACCETPERHAIPANPACYVFIHRAMLLISSASTTSGSSRRWFESIVITNLILARLR